MNDAKATLHNLQSFKKVINEPLGQESRIVIKRTLQKVDQEWLITLLRNMRTRKAFKNFANPWNAFQSVFVEAPFDVFNMEVGQVAMLYHTVKDHLNRHLLALTLRPTGSIWDFVPEPPRRSNTNDLQPVPEAVADPAGVDVQQEEEDTLKRESEELSSMWVEQMMTASNAPMPLNQKVANFTIALLAIAVAMVAFHSPQQQTSLLLEGGNQ